MEALKGIKIIDFTRLLPGPLATLMLGQMGAEIIKIESPKRMDYARYEGFQVDGASSLFHQLNHNKECRSIDYSLPKGKAALLELVKDADVVIEQFRPGAMESWGLGYEDLKAVNPNIVYVSLTGFGQQGIYRNTAGHDMNYLATAGLLSLNKDDHGKPVVPGFQLADICGGAYMIIVSMQTALIQKMRTGEGRFVDVNMTQGVMPLLTFPLSVMNAGLVPDQMNILNGKLAANYTVYECADGKWLSVAALEPKFWKRVCTLIGKEEWAEYNQMQLLNIVFPKAELEAVFKSKTRDEWANIFEGEDVCIAPIL
ncbi:MAG: CaiB/BaiF CoA-transferase family protein, partial [Bacteroidota bacterium]